MGTISPGRDIVPILCRGTTDLQESVYMVRCASAIGHQLSVQVWPPCIIFEVLLSLQSLVPPQTQYLPVHSTSPDVSQCVVDPQATQLHAVPEPVEGEPQYSPTSSVLHLLPPHPPPPQKLLQEMQPPPRTAWRASLSRPGVPDTFCGSESKATPSNPQTLNEMNVCFFITRSFPDAMRQ